MARAEEVFIVLVGAFDDMGVVITTDEVVFTWQLVGELNGDVVNWACQDTCGSWGGHGRFFEEFWRKKEKKEKEKEKEVAM